MKEVELHHFSDASEKGYGQCSYLRFLNTNDEYHSTLVMAKSRVAPLRAVTIPRKELQAAVLSARMSRFLQEELHYKGLRHYFWTDSQIVLAYLNNQSKRFHVFVANRIQQILEASTADQWRYVPSNDNPADHASRGLTVNELKSTEWFSGPAFLRQALPEPTEAEFSIPDDDVEVKRAMTTSAADVKTSTWEERFKRFSTKRSLIRAIALLMRHCHKYEAKTPANSSLVEHSLTRLESYRVADLKVVKISQQEHFASPSREDKSSLKDLDCYKDENEMLRVGGRIDRSAETNELRHPVVLPHQSHLAVLVARACHAQIAHQGRPFTINEIRRQGFWILGMRRVVLAVIRHCTVCIRHRGRPEAQKMAELPEERVNESAPFTHCGVDCFGPFHVKDGRKEVKRYGLLITCLSSRAVHIEVLDDLSTDSFINGLRVLMALRGNVRSIRCDRGTNFVGANNELKAAWKGMNQEAIVTRLLKDSCEFLFNPPTASHMGGLWERQIRTVRSVLSGLLDKYGQRLTSSTLRTFMYEAMAIVNSRPLCVESLESPDGPLPLTPNHLLTMKPAGVLPPPGNFSDADVYARKRWRCVQHLADEFWRRWRREYLASLQLRQKWLSPMPNVKVGDVVLLHDDTAPRAEWSLARVTEVFPSRDGLVRSVKVLLAATLDARGRPIAPASVLTRPVHKLTVWVRDRDAEQRQ